MRRIPRALAAAALVGAVASIPVSTTGAQAAPAPKCPTFDLAKAVKAPFVFHARVTGAGKKAAKGGTVVYPASVMKPLKGVPATKVTLTLNPGPCQPKTLAADEDYYFFVIQKAGTYIVAGTQPMYATYTDKLQAQVSKYFPGTPPPAEPQKVNFGHSQLDDVSSLTSLAAPGVVLILIGALGFLAVLLFGRRTAS